MYITINDRKIFLNIWDNVKNPKGIIQIIHGMAEYGARYEPLADFFNGKGYIVVASDHFGHKNSINKAYGELGIEGFETYVNDELYISKHFKEKYEMPIHILCHSMGSFIGQYLMTKDLDYINSYTIIGSCFQRTLKVKTGSLLINLIGSLRKFKEDKLIDKLMFGNFSDKFEKKTAFDWLSKNEKNVHTYINDPHCGKIYPTDFYMAFVKGMWQLHSNSKFLQLKNKKPLLIMSGKDDPVGEFGSGVIKLKNFFVKNGFSVEFKLYEMLRHELLNEDIKEEIFEKILKFIETN